MLSDILNGLNCTVHGNIDTIISGLSSDSRTVRKGNLFVALRGTQSNGHNFIAQAITGGAAAIMCEEMPHSTDLVVPFIVVKDSVSGLALAAKNFFNDPSSKIILTGVTGTNGKTTTATLLYKLFRAAGYSCGLLSTVANYINDKMSEATHTTPDIIQLNCLLNEMVQTGCTYCFMEVSSHAAVQRRIEGLTFKAGVFTNITHDHLDYHGSFDQYIRAKKLFFDSLPAGALVVINDDDRHGRVMVQNTRAKVISYALKCQADHMGRIIESHLQGMQMKIDGRDVWTHFIGGFNGYNLLAVYSCAVALGMQPEDVLQIISMLTPVSGRFDYLTSLNGVTAIIDYAHTPDALENVLDTIQHLARERKSKIITVVGAGGNRDKLKRPVMARIAVRMSDKVILTSDNPRFENPDDILKDMRSGVDERDAFKVLVISNRREAIRTALSLAVSGDLVLIAGKGHENYQEVNGIKHHFDDKEEVTLFFNINKN